MFEALFGSILLAFEVLISKKDKFKMLFKKHNVIFAVLFIAFFLALIFNWWICLFLLFIALIYLCVKTIYTSKKEEL